MGISAKILCSRVGWAGAASFIALAAAGCATTASEQAREGDYDAEYYAAAVYPDADRVFRNGYVRATRPISPAHAIEPVSPRQLAAYEGVEGARRAHQTYDEPYAEQLDGACEQYVKIVQGETLYDIAQYCDVSLSMLMDYNPAVRNPRTVFIGQLVEVPYTAHHARRAEGYGDVLQIAAQYVVRPGDTLSSIAASHLSPASALVSLNPQLDWNALPVGATVNLPGSGGGAATPSIKPVLSYLGDGDFSGAGRPAAGAGYSDVSEVTKLMPYNLKPLGAEEPVAANPVALLSLDKATVTPGQTVWSSASGLPANAVVAIAVGPNRSQMRVVETVRAGPDGTLNARVRVPRLSGMGGVIVTATVEDTGETLYSERIPVLEIQGRSSETTVSNADPLQD